MARNTPAEIELLKAIEAVRRDTAACLAAMTHQLGANPPSGWSEEKHDAYWNERIKTTEAVLDYLFIRSMQIDPD